MLSADKNKNAYNIWAQTYDFDRPPHTYLEEPYFLKLINANKEDTILDAACGTGRYSKILSGIGAIIYGCDLSEKMIEIARVNNPKTQFKIVDLNGPLPFESQTFTKIICSLSIRHIENLQGFLFEVYRLLKPGGYFIFSAIHAEMDWSTYERSNPPPIELNAEGVTFSYSKLDFEKALAKTDFQVQEIIEIIADDTIKPFLTDASFSFQKGRKFVLAFLVSKQAIRKSREPHKHELRVFAEDPDRFCYLAAAESSTSIQASSEASSSIK